MKKIPRAEISTIKGMLYPEKKNSMKEWNKKNLKSIKELEEKNKKLKEEKKNFVLPEPYKIEKYKNIPSKLKMDTTNWIINEQNKNILLPRTANYGQRRNYSKPRSVQRNTKPKANNSQTNPSNNEIKETGEENIYNLLNNKKETMFDKYYASKQKAKNHSINSENNNNLHYTNSFNSKMNNDINKNQDFIDNQTNNENDLVMDEQIKAKDAAIEKLIKEYKEKYGTDEALESMINEYYSKNKSKEITNNQLNNTNNNLKNNNCINNDSKLVLPKIQKNFIRENRQLVIDNKIPLKHKVFEEPVVTNNKHKDYGKVPNYIKKYELEREIKKEEIKRQEEAAKYPKGTKLLTEEERLSTLNGLIENKKEITNQLEKMPITTRTNSIRIRKEELYKKLEEIEKAIDMFSRKQVFVKI